MRFTYHASMCDPSHYLSLATLIEDYNFDGFTLPDSISYPKQVSTKYPYSPDGGREFLEDIPFLDPFCVASAMAALTKRITFSTSVLKLPIRNPALVAKQAATLAVMSNNRLLLGVGLSPWPEDFELCNERWSARGKRMDDMISIMRGLWSGDYYQHDSEFYQIASTKMSPAPTMPIPVLTGGHSDAAFKRAARIADGFISAGNSIEELKEIVGLINRYRSEYGNADKPFQFHAITGECFTTDNIKRLEDIGIHEVIVGFRDVYAGQPDVSLEKKIEKIKWYADTVISQFG